MLNESCCVLCSRGGKDGAQHRLFSFSRVAWIGLVRTEKAAKHMLAVPSQPADGAADLAQVKRSFKSLTVQQDQPVPDPIRQVTGRGRRPL